MEAELCRTGASLKKIPPENALTTSVATRNLHYLINNNEDKWETVVKYCLVVLIERLPKQDDAS
ncbi:MAG: hypothetical protein JXR21_04880 [Candidatus Marinimicrobia bacterium]|nr:hypothetical protein [Candidatus Neomarinimicrobiota bacterium]